MEVSRLQSETEIVDFRQPLESDKNLYLTQITVNLPEEEALVFVQEELNKAFSRFGPLYSVRPMVSRFGLPRRGCVSNAFSPEKSTKTNDSSVLENPSPPNGEPVCRLYAFVEFYSKLCARRAKQELQLTKIVGTTPCKIQFSNRKKSAGRQKEPLYPSECSDVANYYLGFDGWSTAIKLMKREDPVSIEPGQSVCRFLCVVELVVPRHGLTTHGIGTAQEILVTETVNKGGVFARCRKKAHREAVRDAFSRLLLVVVGGGNNGGGDFRGKVYAEVDTTIPDPVMTSQCLNHPSMLTVNELLVEPKEEDSEEEGGGGDEEGEEEDPDNEMVHILADLQTEHN